jgi:hypothetical protein
MTFLDGESLSSFRAKLNGMSEAIDEMGIAIDGIVAGSILPFDSVSDFYAASIPADVNQAVIDTNSEVIFYVRRNGANGPDDLTHPDGSDWAKSSLIEADLLAAVTDIIEEGQFPTYIDGEITPLPEFSWSDKTTGTVTYGSRAASFVRFGRMVYVDISFVNMTIARGSETGSIRITGLPYQSAANTFGSLEIRRASNIDFLVSAVSPMGATVVIAGGDRFGTLTINPANGAALSAGVARCSATASAVTLQVTGWYQVQD